MGRYTSVQSYSDSNTKVVQGYSSTPGTEAPKVVVEKVLNVMGSNAGAGSGEMDLYRAARRKEKERMDAIEKEAKELEEEQAFRERVERNRLEAEEKTKRNAEKRKKKKMKRTILKTKQRSSTNSDDSSSEEEVISSSTVSSSCPSHSLPQFPSETTSTHSYDNSSKKPKLDPEETEIEKEKEESNKDEAQKNKAVEETKSSIEKDQSLESTAITSLETTSSEEDR